MFSNGLSDYLKCQKYGNYKQPSTTVGGGNPFYASLYIERSYLTEEELQYLMTAPLHHLHQYPLRGHQLLYLASERK